MQGKEKKPRKEGRLGTRAESSKGKKEL